MTNYPITVLRLAAIRVTQIDGGEGGGVVCFVFAEALPADFGEVASAADGGGGGHDLMACFTDEFGGIGRYFASGYGGD